MSSRILILMFLLTQISACGVKSKPVAPRDPNLDDYIQEKLKKQIEDKEKKKKENLSN